MDENFAKLSSNCIPYETYYAQRICQKDHLGFHRRPSDELLL